MLKFMMLMLLVMLSMASLANSAGTDDKADNKGDSKVFPDRGFFKTLDKDVSAIGTRSSTREPASTPVDSADTEQTQASSDDTTAPAPANAAD